MVRSFDKSHVRVARQDFAGCLVAALVQTAPEYFEEAFALQIFVAVHDTPVPAEALVVESVAAPLELVDSRLQIPVDSVEPPVARYVLLSHERRKRSFLEVHFF